VRKKKKPQGVKKEKIGGLVIWKNHGGVQPCQKGLEGLCKGELLRAGTERWGGGGGKIVKTQPPLVVRKYLTRSGIEKEGAGEKRREMKPGKGNREGRRKKKGQKIWNLKGKNICRILETVKR